MTVGVRGCAVLKSLQGRGGRGELERVWAVLRWVRVQVAAELESRGRACFLEPELWSACPGLARSGRVRRVARPRGNPEGRAGAAGKA